jgi:rRNA maturation endonuclease Nob1
LKYILSRYTLGGMAKVQLWGYRCERCGHEWLPRNKDEEPRVCPKCKSPYWNRSRKRVSDDKTDEKCPPNASNDATGAAV